MKAILLVVGLAQVSLAIAVDRREPATAHIVKPEKPRNGKPEKPDRVKPEKLPRRQRNDPTNQEQAPLGKSSSANCELTNPVYSLPFFSFSRKPFTIEPRKVSTGRSRRLHLRRVM